MVLYLRLRNLVQKYFTQMRWYGLLLSVAVYAGSSWVLLWLCGEHQLVASQDFYYWLVVSASTVGYGDLSPSTVAGKWVVALYIIPVGLGLFALTIGRFAAFLSFQWLRGIKGLKALNIEDHVLIIGWCETRTIPLIQLLLREQEYSDNPRLIVLCAQEDMNNPLPDRIEFVRARSFSDAEDMDRAGIGTAACIIIDNPQDDSTMTAALYSNSRNPSAHIIAYFVDENLGRLLQTHCPNVEHTPSVAIEMIAKAAVDPGSSMLHHQLLNVAEGMTQYSVCYPKDGPPSRVEVLFRELKRRYEATLIGFVNRPGEKIQINPALSQVVDPGAVLYYIADERVRNIDWEPLYAQ